MKLHKVLAYIFILFLGFVAADALFPGVKVTIYNEGPGTLKEPTINLLGKTYRVEDIPEEQSGFLYARVRGSSPLEIEFTNKEGKRVKVTSEAHYFSGIDGNFNIHIKEGKIEPVAVESEAK